MGRFSPGHQPVGVPVRPAVCVMAECSRPPKRDRYCGRHKLTDAMRYLLGELVKHGAPVFWQPGTSGQCTMARGLQRRGLMERSPWSDRPGYRLTALGAEIGREL